MDLTTTYLGLELAHPLMPGASPLVDDLDAVRRLEDAGALAIVLHSLFEEQIEREEQNALWNVRVHEDAFAEALSYLPRPAEFALGPATIALTAAAGDEGPRVIFLRTRLTSAPRLLDPSRAHGAQIELGSELH